MTSADGSAGEILWTPTGPPDETTAIGRYIQWLGDERDLKFQDFESLWEWSVGDLEGFWSSIAQFMGVRFHDKPLAVLEHQAMPGAVWFRGATLNYAEHAFVGAASDVVLVAHSQTREPQEFTRRELQAEVARARAGLVKLGVGEGDRVAAYLPNIPEAIIAFLATASLGAIWISCAPEFGNRSVLDRLQQVDPKVLIVVDGYMFGDRRMDRADDVAEIRAGLPSVQSVVTVPYLDPNRSLFADELSWGDLMLDGVELEFAPVPFAHPLYVLFSSGTTGRPKAIVHGHGGMVLEHMKWLNLHADVGPGERFFMPSTTGWMAWNASVSALLTGASLLIFDGDPTYPDLGNVWRLVGDTGVTHFGMAAPFITTCRKAGLSPKDDADLSKLRGMTVSGAPLPAEGFKWIYDRVRSDVLLSHPSGGTDVCSAFVGMNPLVPVYAGEITRPFLGCAVDAFDDEGRPVDVAEQGELVVTVPMPSMPVQFWNDPGDALYKATYYDRFPGVWCHGDWVTFTDRGTCFISGRSDATLNRGGVRLGTAEFYNVLDDLDGIADSLVVHVEDDDQGMGELLLFVVMAPGLELDDARRDLISSALRRSLSPRHAPNEILEVPLIPRNVAGKKLEVPIKRLLSGTLKDPSQALGSIVDASAMEPFLELAERRAQQRPRADEDGVGGV